MHLFFWLSERRAGNSCCPPHFLTPGDPTATLSPDQSVSPLVGPFSLRRFCLTIFNARLLIFLRGRKFCPLHLPHRFFFYFFFSPLLEKVIVPHFPHTPRPGFWGQSFPQFWSCAAPGKCPTLFFLFDGPPRPAPPFNVAMTLFLPVFYYFRSYSFTMDEFPPKPSPLHFFLPQISIRLISKHFLLSGEKLFPLHFPFSPPFSRPIRCGKFLTKGLWSISPYHRPTLRFLQSWANKKHGFYELELPY